MAILGILALRKGIPALFKNVANFYFISIILRNQMLNLAGFSMQKIINTKILYICINAMTITVMHITISNN